MVPVKKVSDDDKSSSDTREGWAEKHRAVARRSLGQKEGDDAADFLTSDDGPRPLHLIMDSSWRDMMAMRRVSVGSCRI